jgi:hypothetical protein
MQWRERASVLSAEYIRAVATACVTTDILARSSCLRQTTLSSFGNQGGASAHCPQVDTGSGFFECVMVGSTAERILVALGGEADAAMNWGDPLRSLNLASRLVAVRASVKCRGSTSGGCVAREMASALNLYPSVGDQCAALAALEDQARCIGEALIIDQLESALLYVG